MTKFITSLLILLTPVSSFAAESVAKKSALMDFVPLILIFVVFYYLIIRPQQKKSKEHKEILSGLKIGNEVCTTGGIFGKVRSIDATQDTVDLEISSGVVIKVLRQTIGQVIEKKKLAKIKNNKK